MDLGTFGSISFDAQFLSALASIVLIDLILAGDNAVVIAMAVRSLLREQRRRGILLGVGAVSAWLSRELARRGVRRGAVGHGARERELPDQLSTQFSARDQVQRGVDHLVRYLYGRIGRIVPPQPPGNLLGRPSQAKKYADSRPEPPALQLSRTTGDPTFV